MLIRDILSMKGSAIFSIAPDGRVADAVSLMVMDGDRLPGVISFHDVAKSVIKETSFENRLLERYIKNWPEAGEAAK